MYATTNENDFLPSESENRRYYVIECPGVSAAHVREYLDVHRDQIWAQAKHEYDEGRGDMVHAGA